MGSKHRLPWYLPQEINLLPPLDCTFTCGFLSVLELDAIGAKPLRGVHQPVPFPTFGPSSENHGYAELQGKVNECCADDENHQIVPCEHRITVNVIHISVSPSN
jgi:hypothetical protein